MRQTILTRYELQRVAEEIVAHTKQKFPDLFVGLPKIIVTVSTRMTHKAGVAKQRTQPNTSSDGFILLAQRRVLRAEIVLSLPLLCKPENEDQIAETVLHELAHLIVGTNHNHDHVWVSMARKLGSSGKRYHDLEVAARKPRQRYTVWCLSCGGTLAVTSIIVKRLMSGTNYHHRKCGGPLTWKCLKKLTNLERVLRK